VCVIGSKEREGQPIAKRLRWRCRALWPALALELEPACRALGVGRAIRGSQLTHVRRQRIELRWPQPSSQLEIVLVLHTADAVRDNQAPQPLGKRQRKTARDDPPRRAANEVNAIEPEMVDQRQEIVGARAR